MMNNNLSEVGAGFGNETLGSQSVFRSALNALSQPGRWRPVVHDAQSPAQANSAAAGVLLALLDADCNVWASPALAGGPALAWLRFHTGCQIVSDPSQAHFAWIAAGDAVPSLNDFSWGSDAYPDSACTVVLELDAPTGAARATSENLLCAMLTGPGIAIGQRVDLAGLPADFAGHWTQMHAAFPRGVDVFLAQGDSILGLPRTTAMAPLSQLMQAGT